MLREIDRRVQRARSFRQNPTDAERKLWQQLRHLPDAHFRRQATIGPYFADFACHKNRLVVEVDGGQHVESLSDEKRTAFLIAQGYRVLRFWNHDVLKNVDGVLQVIVAAIEMPPTPDPSPPREECVGGGEKATQIFPSPRSCGGPRRELALKGSGVGGALCEDHKTTDSAGENT